MRASNCKLLHAAGRQNTMVSKTFSICNSIFFTYKIPFCFLIWEYIIVKSCMYWKLQIQLYNGFALIVHCLMPRRPTKSLPKSQNSNLSKEGQIFALFKPNWSVKKKRQQMILQDLMARIMTSRTRLSHTTTNVPPVEHGMQR